MNVYLHLVGLAASLTSFGAVGDAGEREGPEALAGTWRAVSASREGGAADDLLGHRLSFTGDRFVIRSAGGEVLYRGSFEANPANEPPTIDFRHQADPLAGTTWLGVYRIEGGKLRICDNAADPARPRPTGFDPKPGSGAVLVTFERATP
jgi:uncharacterized protein (TIGR03067 family)